MSSSQIQLPATDEPFGTQHSTSKDTDFWFDDANIVIIAQSTAFRVHRGLLSQHSDVFRDLFTIPQPVDEKGADTMDGCPVVRLPDTSYDVRELLRVIYGGVR